MTKEFKKHYFDSGVEFQKKSVLHKIKAFFFSNEYPIVHYNEILLNRWKFLKKSNKILDIGCGLGDFIKLNPYKKEIYGIDIIEETIKELKKRAIM